MEWSTGVVCARGEGNIGACTVRAQGALKRVRGPRHTFKNRWGVSKLSPFPAARLIGSTSSFPLPSSPLVLLCPSSTTASRRPRHFKIQYEIRQGARWHDSSNIAKKHCYSLTQQFLAAIPWPELKFALRHVNSLRRGLEEFRRAPLNPSPTDHYHRPNPGAREALFVEADTADARPRVGDRNPQWSPSPSATVRQTENSAPFHPFHLQPRDSKVWSELTLARHPLM